MTKQLSESSMNKGLLRHNQGALEITAFRWFYVKYEILKSKKP